MSLLQSTEGFCQKRLGCYWPEIYPAVGRLLSTLDREPNSLTYGSFDRQHWGWKFRDFPIPMMQAGLLPLAQLWQVPFPKNGYYQNSRLLQWIVGGIQETCRRQHSSGAFDSVAPNTHDHGVTLAIIYFLTETYKILQSNLEPQDSEMIIETVEKGMEFSQNTREEYAFINNHQALFALACLNAYELLAESEYSRRADSIIDSILGHQSPDGWYEEYAGPDPGYESLGLFYLAVYWERTQCPRLFESLQKCLEFFAYCIHPDGSIGGVYGSRNTSVYFPGGFEILGKYIPLAASISQFMRANLSQTNVVTPTISDAENLPIFLNSYLGAAKVIDQKSDPGILPQLPCEVFQGFRHFEDSGITVVGTLHYYAIVNLKKGGVCRLFNRFSKQLNFEDAGYLALVGRKRWTSQLLGFGKWALNEEGQNVVCTTPFGLTTNQILTPFKFLILRMLNLTVFRNVYLGNFIKKAIVQRLITNKKTAPLWLTRTMTFQPSQILIRDSIETRKGLNFHKVRLQRNFTPIHMGSAKYFHDSDLKIFSDCSETDFAEDMNSAEKAENCFSIGFSQNHDTNHNIVTVQANK